MNPIEAVLENQFINEEGIVDDQLDQMADDIDATIEDIESLETPMQDLTDAMSEQADDFLDTDA